MSESDFFKLTPEYQLDKLWWKVAAAYFEEHSLVNHQLESFNHHMPKIPTIIEGSCIEYTKDGTNYVINFSNVKIEKPAQIEVNGIRRNLYPNECRIRNLSYTCNIYGDIERVLMEGDTPKSTVSYEKICLGAIPCMVGSDLCNLKGKTKEERIELEECFYDPGGYFIINGTEKVILSQDRSAHGDCFVFKGRSTDPIKTQKKGDEKCNNIPCEWSAEVRSYSDSVEPNITTTYIKLSEAQLQKGEDRRLYVILPNVEAPVPWPIVFKALNVTDTKDMIDYVCNPDETDFIKLLEPSLSCPGINTQEDALQYLCDLVSDKIQKEYRMEYVRKIIMQKLFQNITELTMKRNFLGHMTHELIATALGHRSENDRDHVGYKRVSICRQITDLFKGVWRRIRKEVENNLTKKSNDDLQQHFQGKITNYITPPFATGNWTATKTAKAIKSGVSQIVNRMNYVAFLSCMRRIVTPSEKQSKIIKPRHLHNSQFAYLCVAETPEGQPCGLIKNLALLTSVSTGTPEIIVYTTLELLKDYATMLKCNDSSGECRVFVNGVQVAFTENADILVEKLREQRRRGIIPHEVSISVGREGVRIYTDEGRLLSPFFIVENGELKKPIKSDFTWQDLLDEGIVEYLDPLELETLKISTKPWDISKNDTHSMIHPSFLLGISASTAPFPDHNQSPRNAYQAAMGKQALGTSCKNYKLRCDTNMHSLCYPQKPFVKTKAMILNNADDMPSGQNLVVAIMTRGGYNMEDSVVINQTAIDNGALRSEAETTVTESRYRKGHTTEDIRKPDKTGVQETRLTGYMKLDDDGMCKEGTPLQKRDVVVGKVNKTPSISKDTSVIVKTNGMLDNAVVKSVNVYGEEFYDVDEGSATVTSSYLTTNGNMNRTAVVKVNQYRKPEIGDKVASRSAQKGINGKIIRAEDMPFSEETGISIDLCLNPHAIPSRMTIGHILETLTGKACAMNGATGDATAFEPETNYETVVKELEKFGFDGYGDEVLIDGKTGERINCKIFVGPTYYQRLKHMVADKIHARDKDGSRELLTRQPVEGRKNGGGFKIGEMENAAMVSHGAANFTNDRLITNSDAYETYICDHCGNTAIANVKAKTFECRLCQQNTDISKVVIPYSFKLLQQNLAACNICTWINVDKS